MINPVWIIGLWAVLFVASHLVISSHWIRPHLQLLMGAQGYRGLYSLVALVTLIPLIVVFADHKHAGVMLWYLRDFPAIRGLTWLLMFAALIILVASFVTPNPGGIGAPANTTARGILKLTRHPSFVAISLFGFAHMLMNGWVGDLLFFGSFPALGILGGYHQDHRKLGELGDDYGRLVTQTSFFPGLALWSGRQHWTRADTPWLAIVIGVAAAIVLVLVHPFIFGGSPLG